MYRVLVVLAMILCSLPQIKAQSKTPIRTSKIDSLTRLFDATKDDASKIKILINAPERINEYFEKPIPILNLYNKALKAAQSMGDKKSIIKFLIEIAYLQMNVIADEPKAFKLYSQALSYAEEEKDYASCAKICNGLAAISEHQNFMSQMYEYLLKAISYNQKSPVLFMRPYRWASAMYLEDNRIDDALNIGMQAVSYVDERSASAEYKVLAYGYYYAVLKRIPSKKQEADTYKLKIIDLLGKIKLVSTSTILDGIATVCFEVGQYRLAISFASQVLDKIDIDKDLDASKEECYEIISASYERLGDYQKSFENYKKYSTSYIKFLKNVVSLESGRKVIRAEGERNLILKQKEVEKERFYRNFSFAIVAFIVILGGVVLVFYRKEQKQKRELTQINATKDKLFAILSHDLRSPVASLKNYMMLINWGVLSQSEFVESTQTLNKQLNNVQTMLDNVLNWSITQMGGMHPKMERANIFVIIEEEIKLLNSVIETKEIQIFNQISPEVSILADKNHLSVIVRNLLHNALKFTNLGGMITCSFSKNENSSNIEINDNGIGMSKERLEKLFHLDKSSSNVGTLQEQGVGLGLILVKDLVESNGGKISVSSEINVGTTFVISFPLCKP